MPAADPVRRAARDEQAVLDELARLQRQLEETRRRRRQTADAFNAFITSVSRRSDAPAAALASATGTRRAAGTRKSRDGYTGDAVFREPAPASRGESGHRRGTPAVWAAAAVAAAAVVAAAMLLFPRDREDAPVAEESQPAHVAVPDPVARALDLPAAELMAVRPVWMRVTVDGERVLERELPAGARVPLAGQSVVVRAGDAGAVRLLRRGEDQGVLGADGAVVTRTFLVVPE